MAKPWARPDCRCWCQVRPIVCALNCCGCVIHDHPELATPALREAQDGPQ